MNWHHFSIKSKYNLKCRTIMHLASFGVAPFLPVRRSIIFRYLLLSICYKNCTQNWYNMIGIILGYNI